MTGLLPLGEPRPSRPAFTPPSASGPTFGVNGSQWADGFPDEGVAGERSSVRAPRPGAPSRHDEDDLARGAGSRSGGGRLPGRVGPPLAKAAHGEPPSQPTGAR